MRISVILTTYQSPEWLEKSLWGYRNQELQDFELVIADDGSAENTARLIHSVQGGRIPIRHIWQEDDGFQKSRIMNKAIEAAEGNYLVFSDGDCIPRKDFLATHARLAKPGRFLSGGYVKLTMNTSQAISREDVASGRAFSNRWLRSQGSRNFRRMAKLFLPFTLAQTADLLTTTRATWNGHNASGWRQDIVAANGFDERMQYGGQDRELGERLENAGIRGLCVRHRAICVHLDHDRSYAKLESIRKNKAIRHETRTKKITRTPYGIVKSVTPHPGMSRAGEHDADCGGSG